MTQNDLAKASGYSPSYVNHVITGRKTPSAGWADLVADVTGASSAKRRELHYRAAKQAGFKLD